MIGHGLVPAHVRVGGAVLDAHTLLFASLAVMTGRTALIFGLITKAFAVQKRLLPPDRTIATVARWFSLERTLIAATRVAAAGTLLLFTAVYRWRLADFGPLDDSSTLRLVIPGATLFALALTPAMSGLDLAFCNGVFHRIPPEERPASLALIFRSLRPGGWFARFENDPRNPVTRWIRSRIPRDRKAITRGRQPAATSGPDHERDPSTNDPLSSRSTR